MKQFQWLLTISAHRHSSAAKAQPMQRHRSSGFTLTELMVTIAILAVITGFAAPAMQTMVENYRVSSLTNEFNLALAYTRSQAVNRNMCVTMCIVQDPNAANPRCSTATTDWNTGWMIFSNPTCNNSSVAVLPINSELLQIYEGSTTGQTLNSKIGNVRRISYTARGIPAGALSAAAEFTVKTSNPLADPAKTICLDMAGRARIGAYDTNLCQ
jgi:type IV fimbrial biogenesis protein FimT